MTLDEIPFQQTCGGGLAEFQTSSGEWLRVVGRDDAYTVTRFGADKQLIDEPRDVGPDELADLIARA